MNMKFTALLALTFVSFGTLASVKVTSLDLKTQGANGYIQINLDGRSNELPDIKVVGKTIEMTLSDAANFNAIFKNVSGAQLSANVLNGKAIVKATLPYEVKLDTVNLGWKDNNIEVIFPRGKVVKTTAAASAPDWKNLPEVPAFETQKAATPKTVPAVVAATTVSTVKKEALNEDYLNKLMHEDKNKKVDAHKDEIKVTQAAIVTPETPKGIVTQKSNVDNFSFAGYALKFTVFLAMVLGLFYGIVQILKKGVFNRGKLGFLNNTKMIEVLSTTYIAPKRSLMVVKVHKQIFLVSNSENGIQFLSEMSDTTGLIKEGEKFVTGNNFDSDLTGLEANPATATFKIKENINESSEAPESTLSKLVGAKDIVKFSDELKKKAKKLKPIEFN
jgi:flagellar biogenesis protein FliO